MTEGKRKVKCNRCGRFSCYMCGEFIDPQTNKHTCRKRDEVRALEKQ